MKNILSLVVIAFALGCGGPSAPAAPTSPNAPAVTGEVKAPGEAKIGERARCPVSGETFVVTENSPKVEHNGKTYYLCCTHCTDKFKADPDKYLKGS